MNILKLRILPICILVVLSLSLLMTSCRKSDNDETRISENPITEVEEVETEIAAQSNQVEAIEQVGDTHPLIAQLKASLSREELNNLGELNWTESRLASYSGVDQPGIYVPVMDNPAKILMARYDASENRFDNLVMEIEVADLMAQDQESLPSEELYFSGKLKLSAPTGQLLITKEFERGQVVNSEKTDLSRHPWGSAAWNECVLNCYWDNLHHIPPVIAILCGGACAACFPSAISCIPCSICIATHVGVCWAQCNG